MTAQIGDIYKKDRQEYTVVAMSAPSAFDPKDYGLEPNCSCTACWRGYWCEYNIDDDRLLLQNLFMFNKNGDYPVLNGVSISSAEYVQREAYQGGFKKRNKKIITVERHWGHREYKNVNLPVSYTGRILVGAGFIPKYCINMGFQRCWAYKTLIEFVFEEGILLDCIDHSQTAQELRTEIDAREADPSHPAVGDISQFVEESFSLDYKIKAWWIHP